MIWLRKNIDPRFILNVIILLFIQVFIANRILIMGRFEWYFDDIYSFNLLQNRQVQIFAILIIMLLVANYIPFKHKT